MSLTKTDLKQIQILIDNNNDVLFARFVDVLKQFPTRREVYDIVHAELHTELAPVKADINQLKDDMVEVKADISMLKVSAQSLTDSVGRIEVTLKKHDKDIGLIKGQLGLR